MPQPRKYASQADRQRAFRQRQRQRLGHAYTPLDAEVLAHRRLLRPYAHRPCVYIVQLVERTETMKIGSTRVICNRLSQLKNHYGKVHCLFVLLHETPRLVGPTGGNVR
jgi:hypothetical protein